MLLKTVTVTGYRSVTKTVDLHLDPTVTVILGANDHGKTNILRAITHLNPSDDFLPEDLSWDCEGSSALPSVEFLFELSNEERTEIEEAIVRHHESVSRAVSKPSTDDADEDSDDLGEVESEASNGVDTEEEEQVQQSPLPPLPVGRTIIPRLLLAKRVGLRGKLLYSDGVTGEAISPIIEDFTPLVELIEPISDVSDSVTATEISKRESGFMRGIFWYAGLDPDASAELFVQSPKTVRRLEDASATLNATIKRSWSQGKDLDFILRHNSAKKSIDLMIKDPSVETRYVSASQRSSGFTQFFTIKTILYARQMEHADRSYILLFDEPGIYLHPAGQQDLLQVIESLAKTHQTLYVTHSLFMINKSYPIRHRLVTKAANGTQLEGKPYVGRWARALSALGMSLSGTILFANHVLLTEGDSDPIYIYAMLQKMIEVGKIAVDLNSFAAIATGQSSEADALIRILVESQPVPQLAMLVDGDKSGKERIAQVKPVLDKYAIPSKVLTEGTAIEDYLPNLGDVFVESVARYVHKVRVDSKIASDEAGLVNELRASFQEKFGDEPSPKGVAAWIKNEVKVIAGLSGPPSKVGIAREYAIQLQDLNTSAFRTGPRASQFVKWIMESLKLPAVGADESKILVELES